MSTHDMVDPTGAVAFGSIIPNSLILLSNVIFNFFKFYSASLQKICFKVLSSFGGHVFPIFPISFNPLVFSFTDEHDDNVMTINKSIIFLIIFFSFYFYRILLFFLSKLMLLP